MGKLHAVHPLDHPHKRPTGQRRPRDRRVGIAPAIERPDHSEFDLLSRLAPAADRKIPLGMRSRERADDEDAGGDPRVVLPEFDPVVRADREAVPLRVEPLDAGGGRRLLHGMLRRIRCGLFGLALVLDQQAVDRGLLRDLGLDPHEAGVDAIGGEQFGMRALFDESAAIEGEDAVGVAERGEPMGDRDRRPAADEDGERLLDALLRLGVDVARRLVEHEHPGIVEERPRDREPLLLAA